MPKRKRMKDGYGNVFSELMNETYLNKWACVIDEYGSMQCASMLIRAEGGSLIQIISSKNELYNGVYHIERFKETEKKGICTIIVNDLDVVHDSKDCSYISMINQLPDIFSKYQVEISPDELPLMDIQLDDIKNLPKIMFD